MKKCFSALCLFFFSVLSNPVIASDVQLGAGDVVKISVYEHPDLTLETRVSEVGTISFPLIGEVNVGGLTSALAERKISSLLEHGKFIRNAQVNMIVTIQQSQQVSVLGQVNRPGRYPIDGKRSVIDILALAGGVNADAADTLTLIRTRNGKTEHQIVDVLAMMRTGDMKQNVDLLPGDIVFVERFSRFYIYGEVQRPGVYRLERNMSVLQALSVGGGLTLRGTERGVRIKRRDAGGVLRELTVKHDDQIRIDDVLYVQESLF